MNHSKPNLLILRHGETDGNLNRIVQTPETPLNRNGLRQAQRAAARIVSDFGRQLIIRASDYARAHQTAQAVANEADVPLTNDPLLRERNLGDLRGHAYDDLGLDPFAEGYHPPAGESWPQFFDRVASLWANVPAQLAALPAGHALLLVTHGLVLRALAQNHLTEDRVSIAEGTASGMTDEWPNTTLIALEQTARDTWISHAFNCARHLDHTDPTDTGHQAGIA